MSLRQLQHQRDTLSFLPDGKSGCIVTFGLTARRIFTVPVDFMRPQIPIRLSALTLAALSALLLYAQPRALAQASHPSQATPVTTIPATSVTEAPAPPAAPLTPAQSPPHRATVSYVDGRLTISASNSSLNQILREVSRLTGIKITGGVAEERVFGEYGPAETSDVLGKLLDGTGSNMLLVVGEGDKASELILTPRTGGPSPPNPNAARFDDNDSDETPRQLASPQAPLPESQSRPVNENPAAVPISPPKVDSENANQTPAPATAQPADSTQQSPNGVKTPQQIYDELMRLRRQQQTQPQ